MDEWDGLSVTGGMVWKLSLQHKSLTGSIPPELGDLTGLTELDLVGNRLTGSIPKELGKLTGLRDINLFLNVHLSGPIPTELGDLTELRYIDFSYNRLTGSIPPKLANLPNLVSLQLNNNRLTGEIPSALAPNLETLYLQNNLLTGPVPTALGNLAALDFLGLGSNQLTSVPALPSGVVWAYLSFNQFTSVPTLPTSDLTVLDLRENQLTSVPALPTSVLDVLYLSGNQLTSVPALPTTLRRLYLSNIGLTSVPTLPSSLTTLDLSENQLTSVPTLPSGLLTLDLSGNQLTSVPTLPSGLLTLDLSGNQLTSEPTLPSSLTTLDLSGNQLTSVSSLPTTLVDLFLSGNQLTSVSVSGLTSLRLLDLRDNALTAAPTVPATTHLWLHGNDDVANQLPTVGLSVSPTTVSELAGAVEVTATLSAAVASEVPVSVSTSGATAVYRQDYWRDSGPYRLRLVVPDGDTSASTTTWITIVYDEEEGEEDETFDVFLVPYSGSSGPLLPNTVQPGGTTAVTVTIRDSPLPAADLSAPESLQATVPASFDGSGSVSAVSFSWDFGDGTVIPHPSTNATPSHTYVEPGSYTVRLEVAAGGDGCEALCRFHSATVQVEVAPLPPPEQPPPPPLGGPGPGSPPSDCTLVAPYWSGPTGGFTVRPAPGRTSVSLTCGGRTTEYNAEDGIVTRLVESSCRGSGLQLEGAAPGGWYWQHGDRNAAVAPLVCSEALEGPPAVVPGGVTAEMTDDGTLIRHDTARLIGIVPHLAGNDCAEYVTSYWQGDGGVVVRPAEGRETVRVRVQCGRTYSPMTPSAGEDGVIAELVRKSYCTDDEGSPKEGRLTVSGAAPGGWYWIDGEANAAVAPLMCADLLGGPEAVDPGGVVSRATEDGSYFEHDIDKLIGVVPHLALDAQHN